MRQAAAKTTTQKELKKEDLLNGWTVSLQLLDTAWRVAVPIVVLSLAGIKLDKHFHTQLLYKLSGLFLSLVIASLLVYVQVKRAYPESFKRKAKS